MPHDFANQTTLNAHQLFEVISSKHPNLYQISNIDKLTASINFEVSSEKLKSLNTLIQTLIFIYNQLQKIIIKQ